MTAALAAQSAVSPDRVAATARDVDRRCRCDWQRRAAGGWELITPSPLCAVHGNARTCPACLGTGIRGPEENPAHAAERQAPSVRRASARTQANQAYAPEMDAANETPEVLTGNARCAGPASEY
jgi:hypothetical protein